MVNSNREDLPPDAVMQAMALPDGKEMSWRLVYLIARTQVLLSKDEVMTDPLQQMYLRGMLEAIAHLLCPSEAMPHDLEPFAPSEMPLDTVSGQTIAVPMDFFGRTAGEQLLGFIEELSGMALFDVIDQEVGESGCERDLVAFMEDATERKAQREMADFDLQLHRLLDTNE